jgi:hypothetical protein
VGNKPAVYVDADSYFALLRALKGLPKEASQELRVEAKDIAENIVKPSVQQAIRRHAGPFGDKLAKNVRVTRDRVPKVAVGSRRKAYSGGASSIQIRYGTVVGPYRSGSLGQRTNKIQDWARGVTPGWTDAAARDYTPPAFKAWENAIEHIVTKWNRG